MYHGLPAGWKRTHIVAIRKPGKKMDEAPGKVYRPISLISHILKISESIVYQRFLNNNLVKIPDYFYGYKRKASTQTYLLKLLEAIKIHKESEERPIVALVTTDIKSAFDSVSHVKLYQKIKKSLVEAKTHQYLIWYMANWLTCRKFYCVIDGQLSETHEQNRGLAQGGLLSPLVWLWFFESFPSLESLHNYLDPY